MSQKKAVKSLSQLEEQLAALKETVMVERLTILGIEEVLTKIKFVHPQIHDLIKIAAEKFKNDLEGQATMEKLTIKQAEKQRDIAVKHANKEYEKNLKHVRKILIQEVFYKMHHLKKNSVRLGPHPLSKRIDRMRLMHKLSSKHIMPTPSSKSTNAELEFDLNVIKVDVY
eukprot:NODE_91_length_21557_cov_0.766660.p15 type:complete len:170 gc:universal NODE_91_length_21557_cov_0.766660:8994-9503(+)